MGSRSPPSYFPLYPHVSMECERVSLVCKKSQNRDFFLCPLIIHQMNIRSLKNPLTKILLLRQELNQLDQNTLLCACVCERMTPNNTWGLLTKQKQCVSVEPKSAQGFHMQQTSFSQRGCARLLNSLKLFRLSKPKGEKKALSARELNSCTNLPLPLVLWAVCQREVLVHLFSGEDGRKKEIN